MSLSGTMHASLAGLQPSLQASGLNAFVFLLRNSSSSRLLALSFVSRSQKQLMCHLQSAEVNSAVYLDHVAA